MNWNKFAQFATGFTLINMKRRPKNVLWVTVFLCSTIFEMDLNVSSALTISSIAFPRREQRNIPNCITTMIRHRNIIMVIKQMPFFESHSAFSCRKNFCEIENIIQKETKLMNFVIKNHQVSGWRKENENRLNFFVSESISIRKGMNPISWQNQTNGRKFVSLSIALSGTKTSHRLSNTLLDTDQYYSYVSGHKYWNYFSYVLSVNLTNGMFSLVAIAQQKYQVQIETHCFAVTMIDFFTGALSLLVVHHQVRANLVIFLRHQLFLSFLFYRMLKIIVERIIDFTSESYFGFERVYLPSLTLLILSTYTTKKNNSETGHKCNTHY